MIFDVLKQLWLRKEIGKLENSSRDYQSYWPKSLVVIFDIDHFTDVKVFKNWCRILNISTNNLTLLAYKKEVRNLKIEEVTLFNKHSVKWNGGLKVSQLSEVLNSKHDLQINYYDVPEDITKYVSLKLESRLRVGYISHEETTYDLAVNVPLTDQELFISEIAKYLKIFNS